MLKTTLVAGIVAVALVVAGCGGSSVESKVADDLGRDVTSCRAVGVTELGKLYSCQSEGTTVCVMVDGDDVFGGSAEAARTGIGC